MAIHVSGAGGTSAASGLDWANDVDTIATAAGKADPVIWCDASQAETTALAATLIVTAGTATDPVSVVSGTPTGTTGLSAVATGYDVTYTGTGLNVDYRTFANWEGITWNIGTGTNSISFLFGQVNECINRFKNCTINIVGSNAANQIRMGVDSNVETSEAVWDNHTVSFASTGQTIAVRNSDLTWNGGSVVAGPGSVVPNTLFSSNGGRLAQVTLNGVDLSALTSTFNFFVNPAGATRLLVRGCKLPGNWNGSLLSGTIRNARAELYDCDTTLNSFVRFIVQDRFGLCKENTTTDRTGIGDVANYSIDVSTTSEAQYGSQPFVLPEIKKWNAVTGSARTAKIYLTSSSSLFTKDIVLRLRYLGDTTSPKYSEVTTDPGVLNAGTTALTTNAQAWNSQLTNRYELSVPFTARRAGYVIADVLVYKPNISAGTLCIAPELVLI